MLADLLSGVQAPGFIQFVLAAVTCATLYLFCTRVFGVMTRDLVRKSELKKELDSFKIQLVKELVTTKDLELLGAKQTIALNEAMKETRHSVNDSMNKIFLPLQQKIMDLEIMAARILEYIETQKNKH
jgi:hypothetical protein